MSFSTSGGRALPGTVTSVFGSTLRPVIFKVAGKDRAALEHIVELQGNCTYIAVFNRNDPAATSCYVGMTTHGQDRPRLGQHLADPDLADEIYVITDEAGQLTRPDVQVLERYMFVKMEDMAQWTMRCNRPNACGVGFERFNELMGFGGEVLCLMKHNFGLFPDVYPARLRMTPRQFEPIIYDPFAGEPRGQAMVLEAFGIKARGIDMGEDGFIICAGSEVRTGVVASASGLAAARREETFYTGLLSRAPNGNFIVRRNLWRPTRTAAARFVTGSSASSANWRPLPRPPTLLRLGLI